MLIVCATILINLFSVGATLSVIKREIVGKFSVMLVVALCVLFYIKIPLLFDSILELSYGPGEIATLLRHYNSDRSDFNIMYAENLLNVSMFVLSFDVVLYVAFRIFTVKVDYSKLKPLDFTFMPMWVYVAAAYISVLFFAADFGISFSKAGLGYREDKAMSGVLYSLCLVLYNFFSGFSAVGVWLALREKKWGSIALLLLPYLLLALLTYAKALFVSVFIVGGLYWCSRLTTIFAQMRFINFMRILVKVLVGYFMLVIFLAFCLSLRRSSTETIIYYPLWRDFCVQDLYYSFYHDHISSGAYGSRFLWHYFLPMLKVTVDSTFDPCTLLSSVRFYEGWGSLHPSIYGWFFIDLKWYGVFMALWAAFFLALTEYLREALSPYRLGTSIIAFQCIFVSVAWRGSVTYAFTTVFYPLLTMLLVLIALKLMHNPYGKS